MHDKEQHKLPRLNVSSVVIVAGHATYVLPAFGSPLRLNPAGSSLWRLLKDSVSMEDLQLKYVLAEGISVATARNEISLFIDQLVKHGILEA